MKLRGVAIGIVALLAGLVALTWASPASALTDYEGGLRYVSAPSGLLYANIEDGRGNTYIGGAWSCGVNYSGSGIDITPATESGNQQICPDRNNQPADYIFLNADGADRSLIIINGTEAQTAYGLRANQGVPSGRFVGIRSGSPRPNEVVRFVTINNGTVVPQANPLGNITYHPGAYQFLDDQYETIIDTSAGSRFEKIDGCVGSNGEVLPETNSECSSNTSTYFVYQSGNDVAYLQFVNPLPAAGTDISTASLSGGLFKSFSSNVEIDRIEDAPINSSSFFITAATEDFDTKCIQSIGVLSWILCPIINFAVDNIAVPIQDFILNLLETDSLLTAPATNNNTFYIYHAWSQFRTIANALLAGAFVVLIYMMLFSQNNNFSLQRTLPRLVVITIMIQISYFIAAIIVDIGNISADGIANIFNYVRDRAVVDIALELGPDGQALQSAIPESTQFLTSSTPARGVGAGLGILLAVFGLYMWTFFIPGVVFFFSIGLILGLIGVFLVITLRQLGIVVFVVLSPIAFLLGLFPATEKWMREWFDNLSKLVLVYPLIALVFGAGSLLSFLALGNTTTSAPNMLIASAIGLIVLFLIPVLLRFAGRVFSSISASITGLASRGKSGLQGDATNPLSWRSNVIFERAQKQYQFYERAGKVAPMSRRFLRPSWKAAQIFDQGAKRMQGVVSPVHPDNLRRLYWGDKPFKSLAGYANWKQDMISRSKPFSYEIKNITKSPPQLYATLDAALQDTGFLFDRAVNYAWGIGRQYKDKEIDRGTAELMWGNFQSRIKGQGHRLFFGAADPSLLLDHDYKDPADLGGKWFADDLKNISDPRLRDAVSKFRQSSTEDFGNAGTERETGASWRYAARWLNDKSYLEDMFNRSGNQRNINAIDTLKRKADTMNVALNDPRMRAELIARMEQAQGEDGDGARVGGYGQSGQAIRHMEEFVKAAHHAYNYALSRGITFTDEINEFNF